MLATNRCAYLLLGCVVLLSSQFVVRSSEWIRLTTWKGVYISLASQGIDHSKQLDAHVSYSLLYTQRARMRSSCTQALHTCVAKKPKIDSDACYGCTACMRMLRPCGTWRLANAGLNVRAVQWWWCCCPSGNAAAIVAVRAPQRNGAAHLHMHTAGDRPENQKVQRI